MIAGLELGGTKTVVAFGDHEGALCERHRFPTTTPTETLTTAAKWLSAHGPFDALGIAAFGPLGIAPEQPTYGHLLRTPKKDWAHYDLLGALANHFPGLPLTLDTDVNATLLAETRLGAAKDIANAAYITIGTGIGGAILADGRLLHGTLHSEFGHFHPARHPDDSFAGVCPYHGDCLEGLASGPAMTARWGHPPHDLPADHPAWDLEAYYLAQGLLALLAITSPSRALLGGGVSQAEGFHSNVEQQLRTLAQGYFPPLDNHHPFVLSPALAQNAGIQGALCLAQACLKR